MMARRRSALLAALISCFALPAAPLAAQQSAADTATPDSTFLLATDNPARTPSPFLGNGHFSITIPASGLGPSLSLLAGLDEHGPGDVPRIVALPAWNTIAISDGDAWLDAASPDSALHEYHQQIDMQNGVARTSYDWVDGGGRMMDTSGTSISNRTADSSGASHTDRASAPSGASAARRTSVTVETFISRADPHLAGVRLTLVPHDAGRMRVRFAMTGRPEPHRLPLATLEHTEPGWGLDDIWYPGHMIVRSQRALLLPGGGSLWMTSTPVGRTITVAQAAAVTWPSNLRHVSARTVSQHDTAMIEVAFDASPGETYTFSHLVSVVSGAESPQPLAQATREVGVAESRGYRRLVDASARAWHRLWETDIEIDGDPQLQRLVHSMLFYLLCSADTDTALGIPPMALSSAGYYGHIFWDSDTWMFPALVVTHPDIARSLVAFRARALGAARANALANGYLGAMYPWESDYQGHEATPRFAGQNASSEIHVTGDVALAQWQYYLATGDSAWLARDGFPVIRATANFWVSRSTYDSADHHYHIPNVVSVAEGLIGVTDDAYTNAVARKNLEIAATASRRLGLTPNPQWARIAEKLRMPYDSASGFFRTYAGAPDSTLGDVTPLLAYPLGVPMTARAKRAQLEQAIHQLIDKGQGAMMGSTLLSVDAAELGDSALVDSLLPISYRSHVHGPFLMLSETPDNGAVYFATGAGGFLQQVIFGYTGLRFGARGLEPKFAPVLPRRITRLVLRNVHVRGRRYDVVVDSRGRRMVPHRQRVRK